MDIMECWKGKASLHAQDMIFMSLKTLKHAGYWIFVGRIFKAEGRIFERMIFQFFA